MKISISAVAIGIMAPVLLIGPGQRFARAQPTAHFELRLAPGQTSAVMVPGDPAGDTLVLEVWVEVSNVDTGLAVWAYAEFLTVSQDGVITYNQDYTSDVFTFGCVAGGTDNSPKSGDFGIACPQPGGTTEGIGAPALWGTFTVSPAGLGTTSYSFADVGDPRRWEVTLTDFTAIQGSDLSYSIDPALATIAVSLSADTDNDGDVDLHDYAALQGCVTPGGGPPGASCVDKDLNADAVVDARDLELFVKQITGALPVQGDLDNDGDVDLADFGRFQVCLVKHAQPALAGFCRFADVDRDGTVNANDYITFEKRFTGPN